MDFPTLTHSRLVTKCNRRTQNTTDSKKLEARDNEQSKTIIKIGAWNPKVLALFKIRLDWAVARCEPQIQILISALAVIMGHQYG